MTIVIISCSLHPKSRSYIMAQDIATHFKKNGVEAPIIDLREYELGMYDTETHQQEPALSLRKTIDAANAVIMAVPIYNYDVNAAAKNIIELTGNAWKHKLVGFLCAAGGKSSYMSVMGLANSLMLDFRCIIIPRIVYATGDDFGDDREPTMFVRSEKIRERIEEMAETTLSLLPGLTEYQEKR